MKNKIFILFTFVIFSFGLSAQDVAILSTKDSLKISKKNLNKGELFFRNMNYNLAIENLEKVYNFEKENVEVCYMLGISYLNTSKAEKAIYFLEKAYSLNPNISSELCFSLANAYQNGYKFTDAINYYNKYLPNTDSVSQNFVLKCIEECKNGIEYLKDTLEFEIVNFGDSINSIYDDYAMYILPNDTLVIFTSKRPTNIGGITSPYDGEYYEDVYFASKNKDTFGKSYNPGRQINTENPDACVGISTDGSIIYLYSDINSGDIFTTRFIDGKWLKPSYYYPVNSEFKETNLAFAENGKYLYFVSNRTGTFGGKDIFFMKMNSDSTFSEAINLGENINSVYDEDCIFINESNDSLYFSSKGHNNIGGYDIFLSVKDKSGNWQKPKNLGFPINTPYDDMYFRPYTDKFYYSSVHEDNIGENDLYLVLHKAKKVENEEIIFTSLNPKDILTEVDDYLLIYDIIFEANKTENNQVLPMLEELANYMKTNSEIQIEIIGYTDTQGSTAYNDELSEKRSEYVFNYLISKGVNKNQLIKSAKGEENQISINTNEKGDYIKESLVYNRRVEFKVINEKSGIEVVRIDVPKEYQINQSVKNISEENKIYSILIKSGIEKKSLTSFNIPNLTEYLFENNYFYYFGEYNNLKDAENALKSVITKYPDAYIFENKF